MSAEEKERQNVDTTLMCVAVDVRLSLYTSRARDDPVAGMYVCICAYTHLTRFVFIHAARAHTQIKALPPSPLFML